MRTLARLAAAVTLSAALLTPTPANAGLADFRPAWDCHKQTTQKKHVVAIWCDDAPAGTDEFRAKVKWCSPYSCWSKWTPWVSIAYATTGSASQGTYRTVKDLEGRKWL